MSSCLESTGNLIHSRHLETRIAPMRSFVANRPALLPSSPESHHQAPEQACLLLSGCTEVTCTTSDGRLLHCYEIDCGQQAEGSIPVRWDLTLTNKVAKPVRFKVRW